MKFFSTLLLICIFNVKLNETSSPTGGGMWGYSQSRSDAKKPDHWKEDFPICGDKRQSPIDIRTNQVKYTEHLDPIKITMERESHEMVYIEKHRTSLYVKFNQIWKITFGSQKCLRPLSIHWHWGSKDSQGSEHTIDGHSYPIEGHLVSYNCEKYTSALEAISGVDGLYVIGIFYKIGDRNDVLQKIIDPMEPIVQKTQTNVTISEIAPSEILPKQLGKYYQYDGSLTTPPCTENVRWTVLPDPLTIDGAQLDKFRHLESDSPEIGKMVDNYRPIMNSDHREVISSFKSALTLNWNKISLALEMMTMLILFSYH